MSQQMENSQQVAQTSQQSVQQEKQEKLVFNYKNFNIKKDFGFENLGRACLFDLAVSVASLVSRTENESDKESLKIFNENFLEKIKEILHYLNEVYNTCYTTNVRDLKYEFFGAIFLDKYMSEYYIPQAKIKLNEANLKQAVVAMAIKIRDGYEYLEGKTPNSKNGEMLSVVKNSMKKLMDFVPERIMKEKTFTQYDDDGKETSVVKREFEMESLGEFISETYKLVKTTKGDVKGEKKNESKEQKENGWKDSKGKKKK